MDWEFEENAQLRGHPDDMDFWYDVTRGGYINPSEMLKDKEKAQKLEEAIDLVYSFEEALCERFSD